MKQSKAMFFLGERSVDFYFRETTGLRLLSVLYLDVVGELHGTVLRLL